MGHFQELEILKTFQFFLFSSVPHFLPDQYQNFSRLVHSILIWYNNSQFPRGGICVAFKLVHDKEGWNGHLEATHYRNLRTNNFCELPKQSFEYRRWREVILGLSTHYGSVYQFWTIPTAHHLVSQNPKWRMYINLRRSSRSINKVIHFWYSATRWRVVRMIHNLYFTLAV